MYPYLYFYLLDQYLLFYGLSVDNFYNFELINVYYDCIDPEDAAYALIDAYDYGYYYR